MIVYKAFNHIIYGDDFNIIIEPFICAINLFIIACNRILFNERLFGGNKHALGFAEGAVIHALLPRVVTYLYVSDRVHSNSRNPENHLCC